MRKINCITGFCCTLLAYGGVVSAQTSTPFYNNTHFEQRERPLNASPSRKMKYALMDYGPAQHSNVGALGSTLFTLSWSKEKLFTADYSFPPIEQQFKLEREPFKLHRGVIFPAKPGK